MVRPGESSNVVYRVRLAAIHAGSTIHENDYITAKTGVAVLKVSAR
jgi:hypothetical protein